MYMLTVGSLEIQHQIRILDEILKGFLKRFDVKIKDLGKFTSYVIKSLNLEWIWELFGVKQWIEQETNKSKTIGNQS